MLDNITGLITDVPGLNALQRGFVVPGQGSAILARMEVCNNILSLGLTLWILRYLQCRIKPVQPSTVSSESLNCNADRQHPEAYLRSMIKCSGSRLSLLDRKRISSTLLINSLQGWTSSIAAQTLLR